MTKNFAKTEGLEMTKIQEAFAEARRLMDTLGDDHPKTMRAVLHAVELADPTAMDSIMAECGFTLPQATHTTDEGEPLFTVADVAKFIGKTEVEVIDDIAALEAEFGTTFGVISANRIQ